MIQKKVSSEENQEFPKIFELKHDQLRWHCDEEMFKFKTTEELEPLEEIVGQERAIEAIRLGAGLKSKGYNIFVSGLSGTGRLTTVKQILENVTTKKPKLFDYCYVNNFADKDSPKLIRLDQGKGKEFAQAMDDCVSSLIRRLPKLFEDESFRASRSKIIEEYQVLERSILEEFDEKIKPHGFVRGQLEDDNGVTQPEVFPVINEKPVQVEDLDTFIGEGKLDKDKAEAIRENYRLFHNEIYDLARHGMKLMKKFRTALYDNDKAAAKDIVDSELEDVLEISNDIKVKNYLDEVNKYILDNLNLFVEIESENAGNGFNDSKSDPQKGSNNEDKFRLFSVNVILDNSKTESAPIIVETTPSYINLFGTIERSFDNRGMWQTDFTKIKPGALLRADQGYLIVNALDLFPEAGVWQTMKRVLLYDKLEIQPYEAVFQLSQLHLKPEAIDLNVKIIIIGGQTLYRSLFLQEKGFKKMFKVNAQFDYESKRSDEMVMNYARYVSKICKDENFPHFKPSGVAAVAEWAVQHSGSQNKITLKFSDVADIIRESVFYDPGKHGKFIRREDVEKAILCRRRRNDLIDEKLSNNILDGTILIDITGDRVGQINGLTILDDGILSFGKPARITALVSAGSDGIVNIEREVDMSGEIHSKAVMILSSIISEKFAKKKPLALNATIAFEQNYGGIDGDSATAAEIYVILSALAEIPLKQSIAVTGSVNQPGDMQPIGGVNSKITGFYEICKSKGLTGKQGVIIPIQNVNDLMLPKQIVDSVHAKKFHIWPITRYEEGFKILTDIEAGERNEEGKYPDGTFFAKVEEKLAEMRKSKKKKK